MQYRQETVLSAGEYVSGEVWREASPPPCLRFDSAGCRLSRHGTYERKYPAGMRVARWYCRKCHTTFSALPDCLSSRLPGALSCAEDVAAFAEQRGINAAARKWCPEAADFSSARRWVRRRVVLVCGSLSVFRSLEPTLFAGLAVLIGVFREQLDTSSALIELRRLGSPRLAAIPYPVGFDLRWRAFGSQTGPPTEDGPARRPVSPR